MLDEVERHDRQERSEAGPEDELGHEQRHDGTPLAEPAQRTVAGAGIGEPEAMDRHPSRSPRTIPAMSPTTLALVGLVALLVLIPTRRLQLAGWRRESLTTYFLAVWLMGVAVAAMPAPARFLIPLLLVAYLAPFVTLRDGLDRLLGRPRVDRGKAGPADGGSADPRRPMKDVTPPDERDR